ncbi:MAG: hypothetical protein AAGJ08_25140 [Cyanobacteria bacterium P01_H01_bin.35]
MTQQLSLFDIDDFIRRCEVEQPNPQLPLLERCYTNPTAPTPKPRKVRKIQWYRKFFWRKRIPIAKVREWGGGDCRRKQTYINAYEYYTENYQENIQTGTKISQKDKQTDSETMDFIPPLPKPPVAPCPEPEENPNLKPIITKPPKPKIGDIILITSGVGSAGDRHDRFFEVLDVNYSGVFYLDDDGTQYWEQDTGYKVCDREW